MNQATGDDGDDPQLAGDERSRAGERPAPAAKESAGTKEPERDVQSPRGVDREAAERSAAPEEPPASPTRYRPEGQHQH